MTHCDNRRALRDAFGSFMTGITLVTARARDGSPVGFTANSFSSVSLDPPLVLVCPGKFLSCYDIFANCTHFAVSILAEGQEDVSNIFAGFKGDRFSKVAHRPDLNSVPILDGAIAHFSCDTHKIVPAGDHSILIGKVTDFSHSGGPGLGYVGGQYFSLGLERDGNSGSNVTCGAIIEAQGFVLLERVGNRHRPPQVDNLGRGTQRDGLAQALRNRGLTPRINQVYSSFHDESSGTHFTYFLTETEERVPLANADWVPISQLEQLQFSSPAIHHMMSRFAVESRSRDFLLYLGDAQSGDVHHMP